MSDQFSKARFYTQTGSVYGTLRACDCQRPRRRALSRTLASLRPGGFHLWISRSSPHTLRSAAFEMATKTSWAKAHRVDWDG